MRKPIGYSFEIGINENKTPSLCMYPTQFCNIRPIAVMSNLVNAPIPSMVRNVFGGIKVDLLFGKIKRPVLNPFAKQNPWTSGNHWFVIDIPFPLPALFISLGFGKRGRQFGFYFGCKTYRIDHISNAGKWCDESEMGNIYLCPSFSIRETMWD